MSRLSLKASGLSREEYRVLQSLSTPVKIQDFLDTLPQNFEKQGDTHFSPRRVLRERKAHCIEAALLAATALWIHGEPPLVMNLLTKEPTEDSDHVVALYRRKSRDGRRYWGAISKTNHSVLRFRDPIYRTLRELALTYFHEWFLDSTGEKVLMGYSDPLDLSKLGQGWITSEKDLFEIDRALDALLYTPLVPPGLSGTIRPADRMERKIGKLTEWNKNDRGT